jgi:EAL domain-containing protein (putative c-di-GMP-specific phosphodiesterase class I)
MESVMKTPDALHGVNPKVSLESIVSYYQPQFHVASGKLYGAEALARWDHREFGILGPLYVLSRLRSVSLRNALWERMFGHAMHMLEQMRGTDLCIAVNVSADVANSRSWAETVFRRFSKKGISTAHLEIEITEDAGDSSNAGLAAAINQLRISGFSCAIDDFGIGFSSLQRLALMPFSTLKIDRIFVSHARSSVVGQKILANTINLSHDLGLRVIVEGVETKDDFDRIKKLGVDIAQGYYFSRPMPSNDFLGYIQRHG